VRATLVTDVTKTGEIEDAWRSLASLRGNGFVTPEWFRSWWAHREDSSSPLISVARRDDGSVAGVMPLVLDESSRPHVIRFAGAGLGDRFHPAAAEADEEEVARATMAALAEAGHERPPLLLEHIPRDGAWWQQMQGAATVRRAAIEQQRTDMLYVPLAGLGWETFVSQRSAKFRSQIRRRERVLARDHGLELHVATEATLERDLTEFFRLHELRWKGRGSALELETTRAILSDFARAAQRRGWLRLHLLEAEGSFVAAFFGWRLGDSFVSYQGGFDPAWSNKSVGMVLTSMTIRGAIEEGAAEFDFLLGTEAYKQSFTNASRAAENVVLVRSASPTRLAIELEAAARRAGGWMTSRPALRPIARTLRRLLPTARRS
jgi:CelD/BcsL family acetyltransferase involved in cellulose biosynthesis